MDRKRSLTLSTRWMNYETSYFSRSTFGLDEHPSDTWWARNRKRAPEAPDDD